MTKRIIISLCVGLAGLSAIGIAIAQNLPSAGSQTNQEQASDATVVEVLTAKQEQSIVVERYFTGEVVAQQKSSIGFELGGKVIEFLADEGTRVEEKQQLAKLDTRRLNNRKKQMTAQLAQAQAQLDEFESGFREEDVQSARDRKSQAEADWTRLRLLAQRRKELRDKGVVTDDEVEQAMFSEQAALEQLNAAKQELKKFEKGYRDEQIRAQQAIVERLEEEIAGIQIDIDDSVLEAPYSGTIVKRFVDTGTVVSAGQTVFELIEDQSLEVKVGVPANLASRLTPTKPLNVTIAGESYPVQLIAVLPEVDALTRTQLVILGLQKQQAPHVVPGQIAKLVIQETVQEAGFWLPTASLTEAGRGLWSCFAVIENESNQDDQADGRNEPELKTQKRIVEVIRIDGDRVFVRGTINDGDRIVASGSNRIVNNQAVTIP